MEEPKNKYILVVDRVGYTLERNHGNLLALGLSTKSTPTQVLRGELLEALPEAEQPSDFHRIALVGIERESLRLHCPKADLIRLSYEEANLLLAISSTESRYKTFIDSERLNFGRLLSPEMYSQVFVSVKGFTKDLPGVVWYKGELPSCPGTMFGVELTMHPGQGTCDGTYRNKRYFTCPPDSGIFVALDKLRPREDPCSKSPESDKNTEANFKSRLRDTVVPSFLNGKNEQKLPQERSNRALECDQRVVTFIEDRPARGTVRYIGQEEGASGNVHTLVGLEMDFRVGTGNGKRKGRRLFVCKTGFASFVDIGNVIREEDFDENPKEATGTKALDKQDVIQKQIRRDKSLTKSMSDYYRPSGEASSGRVRTRSLIEPADVIKAAGESSQSDTSAFIEKQRQLLNEARLSMEKDPQEENSQRQLSEMEQRVKRMEEQLREKDRELENSERLSSERQQQLTNFQTQLREKELQETSLHEQLREKGQQQQNLQKQLRELEQQLRKKDEEGENLQDRLRVMEQRLREGEDQKENLQRRFREMEQELANLQGQFRDKQERVTTLERQLMVKDRQVNELGITLSTAQQALNEHQRRQVTPDWVISRDQIQLTGKLLGRGGWGSVVVGKYCGCSVAVKQIHELILSPHNRALFEREMNIASRCRHPCLLQFIGATNDEGSPLFVTELMESSLRALLEQRPLAATEVSIISLDVARALNYLHQKKPAPIIHRDISSANMLLWRQGDQWRGKVSDYGTANFMQHTMTVGPGAAIYMAPEAQTSNQTVKVDVYSFGVLLCEMCIRELPDPKRRDQQIAMVTHSLLRALIRGCVQQEPAVRPNMEEIIEELEEPV